MLFSSIPFLYYFLPAVLIIYFLVPRVLKNTVLLLSSLVFYGWGEPKLLFLMLFTIAMFYSCGLAMGKAQTKPWKKVWLIVSIVISVALLGLFKYADFFVDSFNSVTGLSVPLLRLALPVGISFYTFQCLSYTIDVYRGNVPVQKNPISFGAYVALFPQLIAGPKSVTSMWPVSWTTAPTAGTILPLVCAASWWVLPRRSSWRITLLF